MQAAMLLVPALAYLTSAAAWGVCAAIDYTPIVSLEIYECTVIGIKDDPDDPRDVLSVHAAATEVVALGTSYELRDMLRIPRPTSSVDRSYTAYAVAGHGCDGFLVGQRKLMVEHEKCCDVNPPCEGPQYYLMDIHPDIASELMAAADRLRGVAEGNPEVAK
jgi:hypothetical protein